MSLVEYVVRIGLVCGLAYLLLRLAAIAIDKLTADAVIRKPYDAVISSVIRWITVIAALLVVLQMLGVPVSHIFATLSAVLVLVAVGFVAVWSVLSNILCSFLLLLAAPFSLGDEIELKELANEPGFRGRVTGLNLFYTTLQHSPEGVEGEETVRIPNTMFFQRVIIRHKKNKNQELKFGNIGSTPPADTA